MTASPPVPPAAAIADACLRLGVPLRLAPAQLGPLAPHAPTSGPAVPVTHTGSVDDLLEVIDDAPAGGVLVVDNGGRGDEACVGDLVALEAHAAGFVGVVIWGYHRDTAQIREIGMPVHSLGAMPPGPRRVPPAGTAMRTAWLDGVEVTGDDIVFLDEDGTLFVAGARVDEVIETARGIQSVELAQATRMRGGESLRVQLGYAEYRRRQHDDPSLTLRRYLLDHGGAIEV